MPGKYGPGGRWIHDRAHGIMDSTLDQYGPEKGKRVAYAVATQMAHKLKKTPKNYGTTKGKREAKAKFDQPKSEYKKTATIRMEAFFDELAKIAAEEQS